MDGAADHTVLVAALATGAALLGALIAAVTAGRRQKRQLKQDRELHDLAELRSVLDDAAIALSETLRQVHSVLVCFPEPDEEAQVVHADLAEELRKLGAECDRMMTTVQRISLRLGPRGGVVAAYQDAIDLVLEIMRQAHAESQRWVTERGSASPTQLPSRDLNRALVARQRTFVQKAIGLVESRTPKEIKS